MQYKMVDANSAQYKQDMRRLQSLRTQVVLWLIVLALGVMLIPLMLISGWVRNDVARLEEELLMIQSALNNANTPNEESMRLSGEIAALDSLASTMQTLTLPSGVNWPLIIDATVRYDPSSIEITSLTQGSDKLQITGRAASNDAVVRYQQLLLDSAAFKDVVVVSMSTVPPHPTPVVSDDEDAAQSTEVAEVPIGDIPIGNVEFVIDLVMGSPTP
jgi:Tfp pilus assembly protein PilN